MGNKKSRPIRESTLDDLISGGVRYQAPVIDQPAPEEAPRDRSMLRTAGDYGLSLLKGAIAVPEAAVGLADIPTGGRVGKALEEVGFRPKDAKAFLDEGYSDQQKQAFQSVQQAEGFGGKFVAALQNPSVVAHTVAESLPSMGAGGVVGRGVMALAPRLGAAGAAAIGEGVVGAGGSAEQIRQATPGGTMDAQQSGLAAMSGAGTAAFSVLGGRVARALGLNDIDTMLVGAAANPVAAKGVVRRVLEGAVSEGVLEELPQSVQEQVLQNAALGKDLSEGVDQAAVLGLLSGAAMGGGANVLHGSPRAAPAASVAQEPLQPEASMPPPAPPSGPITKALAEATDKVAGAVPAPDRFSPEEVRALNNAFRRPVEDPLGALQQHVRDGTDYTSPATATATRQAVEDAWLRDNVQPAAAAEQAVVADVPESVPQASNQDQDAEALGQAIGHTDAKVRESRILSAVQNLVDGQSPGAAEVISSLDASLAKVGEGMLSPRERARVRRLMDSHAAFTGKSQPAPLPNLPDPVVDAGADNAQLEALVPARAPKPPPAPRAVPAPQHTFATYEEADTYRREQRQRGSSVQGLPIQTPGGGFGLAMRGTPEYAQAEALRDERRVAKERADAGIQDGDILNRLGKPFTVRYAANKAAEKAGGGHDVVPVKGGFVVRAAPAQAGPEMAGRDLGDGWVEFHKDSGTLGIPRAGMPQIKAEHRGAMVNFMNARGVAHREETVQARDLKPTQAEFSRERVEKAKAYEGGSRSILVSRDGHVLDGHHQWLAARDAGDDVKVIRLDAPISDLVKLATEFPSSSAGDGAASAVAPAQQTEAAPTTQPPNESTPELIAVGADVQSAEAESGVVTQEGEQQDRPPRSGPRSESDENPYPDDMGKAQTAIKSVANSGAAGPGAARSAPPRSTTKIEDFGETLTGARKMLYAEAYADGMAKAKELDTKAHPLSKTWPEPDYQKLLEGGASRAAVDFARAAREHIPTKPQSAWKLRGWSLLMEQMRGLADDAIAGRIDADAVLRATQSGDFRGQSELLRGAVALYEALGHERSLKGLRLTAGKYSMYDGVSYDPPLTIWTVSREAKGSAFGNWPRELAKGETREDAIAAFKKREAELLAEEQAPTKGATFEIYSKRAGGAREFFIGKKIGRNVAELKSGFADVKAARTYKAEHQAELEELLTKYKAVPPVRNAQNAPRIGEDYRKGADVTPKQFQDAFGFRGVQFGNYVEGGRRQQDLNRTYDALMDLAGVLGLPPRALSLGGRLGLAFGARGSGGVNAAAAHYEPSTVVINLTKREGAGTLAHEWWHGLDNYFSRQRGEGDNFMSEDSRRGDGVREEMRAAFREVMSGINRTGMLERSRKLDDRRTKEYWTTKPEMSARSFESYVIAKLQDQNAGNDYLANVVGDSVFALEGGYPYPTAGEMPLIREAFDAFFQALDTRQDADGSVAMFSRATPIASWKYVPSGHLSVDQVQREVDQWTAKWKNAPRIKVAESIDSPEVPAGVREERERREDRSDGGAPRGVFYDGTVYLIADQLPTAPHAAITLFHEVLGHAGLRGAFGDALTPILEQIAALRRAEINEKAKEYGLDVNSREDRLIAAEEVLAEWAQKRPDIGYVRRAIAAIRQWLRAHMPGFKNLGMTDDEIVANYLLPARGWVERGRAASPAPVAPRESFKPAFSIEQDAGKKALAEFAKADELFALPKSEKDTVEGIAADNDSQFKVSKPVNMGGRLEYTLTMPDDTRATLSVRDPNPYGGEQVYDAIYTDEGMELVPGRPGENPENVPPTGDVWIDVSALKKGDFGAKMYNIAATYAHNTGRIFIGDPHGLSKDALRRRLEQMISSALKFGTTAHLAPHPDQVRGGHGVPPLRWVYGDDVGNVERMIAASVKALDNGFPQSKLIEYRDDGNFYNANTGKRLHRGLLAAGLGESIAKRRGVPGAEGSTAQAGWRTVARAALFRHLQSSIGDASGGIPERGSLLARGGENVARLERGEAGGSAFEKNERIFYSRAPSDGVNAGGQAANPTSEPDRSTAAGVAARLGDAIKSVTVQNVKDAARYKKTDLLGLGLQVLGRRQIVDIYGKDLPQLNEYNKLAAQMEADKNDVGAAADQLAQRWGKLQDEKQLAELMHDATLAQIDPDKEYVEGDDKAKYQALKRRFSVLSDEARAVYRDARGAYEDHHTKVREAIKQRIMRSELKGGARADLLKKMDDDFFQKTKGVYFPLARFGQYVVAVRGPNGKIASVNRAETMAEAQALRAELVKAFPPSSGHTVVRPTLSKEFIASQDAVGRGFMTELYGALDGMDLEAAERLELEDTLGQLYLSSLPDLSWAKHGIHRKGTPGFSQDARRAFAQNMFHGGRYLAKLRYSDLMQDQITDMQKTADDWKEVEDFDQATAQRVVDEMQKRHESFMNPKSNPLSTALTSLGFVFHLGLSPASAMVNLSQTALVAYPVMGAKWGYDKSAAALLTASKEAAKGKNDITGALNAEERAAYDEAVRAGTIDVTMAHDLAGIAQGEDSKVMWKIRPVMRWASFMFHHAERFNRQVTFIAVFRLAREAGADAAVAFEQATDATYKGHFDYSAGNRPRVMQGNVAKVLLLFKQYGQNMIYTLARNAEQSIRGETPQARKEARRTLSGLLVMHGLAAGGLGLPMVTTLLAAASMIGGDEDEPWDAKVALQNVLADSLGQKPAEVLMHGVSRLTPWDISGRVGLDRLLLPDVQEGLEGQRLWESTATAALGPVASIFGGVLKGGQTMAGGDWLRGLEEMLPAVVRNGVKSIRYANEGAQDKTGVAILDELNPAEIAGQALGFSPSRVRNAYEGKGAVMDLDRELARRRSSLTKQFAMAQMAGDLDGMQEARQAVKRFNEKNPTRRITPMNLAQSVRARQRRIDQAQDGVYLSKSRQDARDAGRFATAE